MEWFFKDDKALVHLQLWAQFWEDTIIHLKKGRSSSNCVLLHEHHMGDISKACMSSLGKYILPQKPNTCDFRCLLHPFHTSQFPSSYFSFHKPNLKVKNCCHVDFCRIVMDDKKLACPLRHNSNPSYFLLISSIRLFLGCLILTSTICFFFGCHVNRLISVSSFLGSQVNL